MIYERSNGVVYSRYRDPQHNKVPSWIVGGDPGPVAKAQSQLLDYSQWLDLFEVANENETLKKLNDK